MPFRALPLALVLSLAAPASAVASDPHAQSAVNAALAAIQKGRGARCGLDANLADRGGYWDCVDIGPYRFVVEYGQVRGFVTGKDMEPFAILESRDGVASYTIQGPWIRDLPARVAAWWSDEFEGGRSRRDDGIARSKLRSSAERAIQSLIDAENPAPTKRTEEPSGPSVEQPAPAPQTQAQRQLAPGGVEIAPGVVRLPDGPPRR